MVAAAEIAQGVVDGSDEVQEVLGLSRHHGVAGRCARLVRMRHGREKPADAEGRHDGDTELARRAAYREDRER